MKTHKYIKIDEEGNILKDITSSVSYVGSEYIKVDRSTASLLAKGLDKVRWDFDQQKIVEKEVIRLSVGTTRFPADGTTTVAICVRGDDLDPDEEVKISINGDVYTVTKREHIELFSEEPGQFRIELADIKYTARPSYANIVAVEPDQDEE